MIGEKASDLIKADWPHSKENVPTQPVVMDKKSSKKKKMKLTNIWRK